ncbi:low temperature requirement protein A [Haladaptatus sp. ZSTT2]|uniref:low temperature requirement protein A n=1 Tax=Haladaptatus sp. ZSTT2 TaxID=3120515 RepID=UPI00300F64FB
MAFDPRGIRRHFKRPLSVYTGREESLRHATWLELFFDLVFVAAIAEIGTNLHHNLTLEGVLYFTGVFVLVWWVWLDYSYYADLYAADDLISRASLIGVMFVVIFLSQTVDGVFHGQTFVFGATMLFLRVVLTVLYLRPRPNVVTEETQGFVMTWITSEFLTTAVWGVSLLVPDPGRFGLWIAAFTINMAGVAVLYTVFDTVLVQVSHFPERLGLITIIVLGETILAVSFGTSIVTSGADFQLEVLLVGLGGFLIAVGAWWLYFGRFDERVIDRALTAPPDRQLRARQAALVYVFSHFFVHLGIVAAGVGLVLAIEATIAGHTLEQGARLILCGGVASFLLGCAILQRAIPQVSDEIRFDNHVLVARLVVIGTFLALIPLADMFSPVTLIGTIAVAFIALIGFESIVNPWVEVPPASAEV